MERHFVFPATFRRDTHGEGFVVSFRDLPEALTQGEDDAEALREAGDCLEEAIAGRIKRGDPLPHPSKPKRGDRLVALPPMMAAKAALYLAVMESGTSKSELARRLGCDEKEARRLLDPAHASKIDRIEQALRALGKSLLIGMHDAA